MAPSPRLLGAASLGVALAAAAVLLHRPASPIAPEPSASASASALASAPDSASAAARALPEPEPPPFDPEEPETPYSPPPPLDARWENAPVGPATQALVKQLAEVARPGLPSREINGENFDIVLEPAARPRLRRLKELAVSVVEARLAEAVALAGADPLPEQGLDKFFSEAFTLPDPDRGGRDRVPLVAYASAQSMLGGRLFGVIVGFEIPGGPDGEIVIFERTAAGAFRRSMIVARHDYDSILKGMLGPDFVARALADGGYHLMTVHSSPWISSAWRGAHLQIFEPTADPARPKRLLDEGNSARIGESGADLSPTDSGFSASFVSWAQFYGPQDDVARTHVHSFALVDGAYRRVAPYVRRSRDLPDEWINRPWSEAQAFTADEARARLEAVHRKLSAKNAKDEMGRELSEERDGDRLVLRTKPEAGKSGCAFVVARVQGEPRMVDVIEQD